MRRNTLFLTTILLLSFLKPVQAQQDTIVIDFGAQVNMSDLPWNNITSIEVSDRVMPLFNTQVEATPFGIRVTDRFNGINTGGITNPDPLLGIPSAATGDSFFGNIEEWSGAVEPTGGVRLSGLDPSKTYTLVIFGSRTASDNRETKYTAEGMTSLSDSLNVSNNTGTAVEMAMVPREDGTIDLTASPGGNNNNSNHFYYLNALKLVYTSISFPQPAVTVASPNGGETYEPGSTQTITWTSENLVEDIIISYSFDNGASWADIDTVDAGETSVDWVVPDYPASTYLVRVKSFIATDVSDGSFTVTGVLQDNDTIMIDFGSTNNISAPPWNNCPDLVQGAGILNLRNANNLQTAIGLEITDRFNGVNENGTTSPQAILRIPATASGDSYYGNIELWGGISEPTAGLQFSGLTPGKEYTFELFASRMGVSDNRETKYRYTGMVTDSVYLNPANNEVNSVSFSLLPAPEGTVILELSPGENNNNGYHFFYIGALKIIYEQEEPLPSSITVVSPNGGETWLAGSVHEISWTSVNLLEDIVVSYSSDSGTSWTVIDSVDPWVTSLDWTLPSELTSEYFVLVASGEVADISDDPFTIADAGEQAIILDVPNGGEEWRVGSIQQISWTPNLLNEDVTVEFSTDNGGTWQTIGTVAADETSISWTVPDMISSECLVRVRSGDVSDISSSTFSIIEPVCSNTIVVLGSSTAAGTGPSVADSAWVWRYSAALEEIDPDYEVVNLALGGYNTFKIVPTGTVFDPGIGETIDENRNVTKALSYSPYAIIVNMPSNDAASNYTAEQTLANLKLVYDYANAAGVRTWIATTQPRNFTDPGMLGTQIFLSTEIPAVYQEYSIDFWTDLADAEGKIVQAYNSGDGVHLNDAGHRILFQRVMDKGIHLQACLAGGTSTAGTLAGPEGVTVYPNPASDRFTITFSTEDWSSVEFKFVDITGRQVGGRKLASVEPGMHRQSFSCEELTTGTSMLFGIITVESRSGIGQFTFKVLVDIR